METLQPSEFPALLREIPDAPKQLYLEGKLPPQDVHYLTVVGTRRYTPYGKEVCEKLVSGLRGLPIVIISGLALGIDGIAHRIALSAGLPTIAVPGSGLSPSVLYPSAHRNLAREIVARGGALLSEYEPQTRAAKYTFPARNRILAGLARATLVIECEEKSGALITSRLATEYNRDVMTVPHPIFSRTGAGPHMLLRLGACLIRNSDDIRDALSIKRDEMKTIERMECTERESRVLSQLDTPLTRDDLVERLGMHIQEANVLLSAMELKGMIKEYMGLVHRALD